MKLGTRGRWLVWLAALAATVAAALWVGGAEEDRPEGARGTARGEQAVPPLPALELERLARRGMPEPVADPFPAKSWYVPPPPAPKMRETAKAPPLPFTFAGRMMTEDGTVVFLSRQNRNYAVREGDVIDGTYRVERIADRTMTLVYLPLSQKQQLVLGGAN